MDDSLEFENFPAQGRLQALSQITYYLEGGISNTNEFYLEFALDIVTRIRQALEKGRKFVLILPAGPIPQYRMAARLINELKVSCRHVHTFNVDEYANEDGETAPERKHTNLSPSPKPE